MRLSSRKNRRGQAIVEYIIIVVIVAIAALAIMGIFSDTIRSKIAGATKALGTEKDVDGAISTSSSEILQQTNENNYDFSGGSSN